MMNIWGLCVFGLIQLSGGCILVIIGHHIGVTRGHQEAREARLRELPPRERL